MSSTPLLSVRSSVPGILWPPISLGVASDLAAMLQQLDRTQWIAQDKLTALQFQQLGALGRHCENHSPQFRRRLRSAGLKGTDLSVPENFRGLPLLRRRDLQEEKDVFCLEVPKAHLPLANASTSGSTGEPVAVRRTAVSNFDWHALTIREHLWHGRDFSKRQCAVRANLEGLTRLADWGPPASLLFETGPILAIPVTADIDRQIDWIAEFAPEYLLIYPNGLLALLRRCGERGVTFPSIAQIRTIGETLTQAARIEIVSTLGVKVVDCYSSQEAGYIAFECPDSPLYHVMAETLIVEILDERGEPCPEGKVGRVVVTDLRNFATPLIRYETGDYAEAGPPCPCGRGLPTLQRILGRERNLVQKPDGTRNWPLVGYAKFRDIAPVRQFQVAQIEPDLIEIRLAVERALSVAEEEALGRVITDALGYPFRMRFTYFEDRIPPDASGKFEEFICTIKQP